MQNSRAFLKNNNILPMISFKDGKAHRLVIIQDKEDELEDDKGEIKKGVKYKVTEDGTPKTFFTSSVSLISKLAEIPEGSEVVIQMKSKKKKSGFVSYFEIKTPTDADILAGEEIPVIQEHESIPDILE